jgi:predicted glycoside hydrolase/deacetylase ChbG (UPF0249 family)
MVPLDTLNRVKRLIVNADDFGLTSGINRAVLELNQQGVLSSTTLMAMASCTAEAVTVAASQGNLGVGCHIVLVDGTSVLPPTQLPTLVNPITGRFRTSLGQFVRDLFLGRIRETEIRAEAEAQIVSLQSRGIRLTHVDTHKHTAMFPGVLRPVLQAARHLKISSIRNPFEPSWSIGATVGAPLLRRLQVQFLRHYERPFRRMVDAAGLITTDGAVGVLATGTLNPATLTSLVNAIPEGTWELVIHPAYDDDQLRSAGTRLTTSRQIELEALRSLEFNPSIRLIHFGQLTAT